MSAPMDTKKSAAMSALILREVIKGRTVTEALDAVCGAGTAARLVDDLYGALRNDRVETMTVGRDRWICPECNDPWTTDGRGRPVRDAGPLNHLPVQCSTCRLHATGAVAPMSELLTSVCRKDEEESEQ